MNFRLVEAPADAKPKPVWPPTRQILDKYSKLKTRDEQVEFLNTYILPHPTFKDLYGSRAILIDAVQLFGLDPRRNKFLTFLANAPITFLRSSQGGKLNSKRIRPKLQYIFDSYKNKKLDIDLPVLKNPSLYDRSDKEFKYTLNAFNMMSDRQKYRLYLKGEVDADGKKVVDVTQFLENGKDITSSPIKPGGSDGRKGDTIFNVIEQWVQAVGEYSPDEIAQRKSKSTSTVGSILKSDKQLNFKYVSKLIDKYIKAEPDEVTVSKEQLELMVYTAFSLKDLESKCENITAQMLIDVNDENNSTSSINPSDLKPQADFAPGVLIHTPNVKEDPVSLYLHNRVIVMTKNDKFVANNVESMSDTIENNILKAPINVTDDTEKDTVELEVASAIVKTYNDSNVATTLNRLWKNKIV